MNMTSRVNDQRGMTGLETAIILIAFVTVAAVFGYAVLSAGLFSAERGKETIYAGLSEAKSNVEIVGSVMGKSSDSANLTSVSFSLRNSIAGTSIDLTPCNGASSATNKCVISLTTNKDYISNIKWTRQVIGSDNSNNLLEPGEQFEITIDLADLGDNLSLSENLSANSKFTLQIKPSVGATLSLQRTLPASIGAIMDLDLGTSFGGGTGSSGGSSGSGATGTSLAFTGNMIGTSMDGYINSISVFVTNTGATDIDLHKNDFYNPGGNTFIASISYSSTLTDVYTEVYGADVGSDCLLHPGGTAQICLVLWMYTKNDYPMAPGETFTIDITPQGCPTISVTNQLPGTFESYMEF